MHHDLLDGSRVFDDDPPEDVPACYYQDPFDDRVWRLRYPVCPNLELNKPIVCPNNRVHCKSYCNKYRRVLTAKACFDCKDPDKSGEYLDSPTQSNGS